MENIKKEFHSLANIFPMMTDQELESLKQDIQKNGLREPIYLFNGKIIDGRNRYLACLKAGIKPIFRNYKGNESDLLNFVISLNLHRRHLTTSQKACLSVDILPEIERQTKENLSKKMSIIRKSDNKVATKFESQNSNKTASNIFGVSERYVTDAKKIFKESPEVFNRVKAGKLTLQQAKKELNQNEVSAILPKPENLGNIELSKTDKKKINEYVKEFGISEQKATEYILKLKSKKKPKPIEQKQTAEIKFRLSSDEKEHLQAVAKERNISVAELIRKLLKTKI